LQYSRPSPCLHLPLCLLFHAALITVRLGKIKGLPLLLLPRPVCHRCQAEPPPTASCSSHRATQATWSGMPQGIRDFLPHSSLQCGPGVSFPPPVEELGPREGKGPFHGLQRSRTLGPLVEPYPIDTLFYPCTQGLDPCLHRWADVGRQCCTPA
jgi:hypothetical protein